MCPQFQLWGGVDMLGYLMVGMIVLDIIILYTAAFAGGWMLRIFGGDWCAILFAWAVGSMVLCLGVAGACQPVSVQNSKEVARDLSDELKDLNGRW